MKIGQMVESKFIRQQDLTQPRIATITHLTQENVGREDQPELKYCLHFQEADLKPLVLNKINIELCALACASDETDEWTGKQIVLWADPTVSFGGKLVGGVRVRPHMQPAAQPAPPQHPTGTPAQAPPAPATDGDFKDDIPW